MTILPEILLLLIWLVILPSHVGLMFFPQYAACWKRSRRIAGQDADAAAGQTGEKITGNTTKQTAGKTFVNKEAGISGYLCCLLAGMFLFWALFEPIAVLCIWNSASFSAAIGIWAAAVFGIVMVWAMCTGRIPVFYGFSLRPARVKEFLRARAGGKKWLTWILFAAVLAAVLFQVVHYLAGMYLDQDDSRFLAEAVEAYQHNTLLQTDPANGLEGRSAWAVDFTKDAISPWPIWLALYSRLTGIHPAIFSHTFYSAWLLLIFYVITFLTGRQLFHKDRNKTYLYMLAVAVCMMFFAGSTRTMGEFVLHRIWQGKAALAGTGIPLLFLEFLTLYMSTGVKKSHRKRSGIRAEEADVSDRSEDVTKQQQGGFARCWLFFLITDGACCLMSGMGIMLAAFLILVGSLWYFVAYRRYLRSVILMTSALPSLIMGLCYLYFRLHGIG